MSFVSPSGRSKSRSIANLDGLGATPVSSPTPAGGKPQSPIFPLIVGSNGAFGAIRRSPAQGSCGVHGYPCAHPGTDVNGPSGTPVRAPENGIIVAAADGSAAPFGGYGPWLVVLRGLATGKFHLLGHLDPAAMNLAPIGLTVSAGTVIGKTSSANHTHWEVRKKLVPDFARGETNATNNTDPLGWLSSASGSAFLPILVVCSVAVLVYLRTRR